MRFYLPLPDFFAFGTKKWSLFDFHEIFRKCLSPNYLATCKLSKPPMPDLYRILCLKNPLFALLAHARYFTRPTSFETTKTKQGHVEEMKHSSLSLAMLGNCGFKSTLNSKLILWLFVTYRLWPVLVQIIGGFCHRTSEVLTGTCSLTWCEKLFSYMLNIAK